jgi:hypothetical protein
MQFMRREPSVVNMQEASAKSRARRRIRDLAAAANQAAAAAAADPATVHPAFDPPARGGRAWLNGKQIGRVEPRYAHLTRAYE